MRDPAIGGNKALVFPPWFPPYLEPEACRLYAKAVGLGFKWKIAMVERLVSDVRMQRVWRELSEHRRDRDYRGTDIFEHQATPPKLCSALRDNKSHHPTDCHQRSFLPHGRHRRRLRTSVREVER
jgi:hypothetical protein